MLPHPAVPNAADVARSCTNKSAAGQLCGTLVDVQQHHCYGCGCGGGVDRRHAAVARRFADVTHSHNGTKVYIEQAVPALTRLVNGQVEHAHMDIVFDHNGSTTYLDVAIVLFSPATQPSSQQPAPAQVTWPRELTRSKLTDIHTSTLSCSSWRPLPKSSSATS